MADVPSLPTDVKEELEAESHAPYMRIWFILAVLTGVEYFYALIFKDHFGLLVGGLVALALVKAALVGWYFMHLKFEKKWVYILIIPACVMAVFLTMMLVPDMVMKPADDEFSEDEESWNMPAPGGLDQPVARLVALSETIERPSR